MTEAKAAAVEGRRMPTQGRMPDAMLIQIPLAALALPLFDYVCADQT
ncbi:hypothetical protein [Jannaschia faecimaris]|nr:hypothetical protein [Jannaschia faecimaris]